MLADLLNSFAQMLGIKSGEAAQVLAGLLGAAGGLAAAWAAWRSAKIAEMTVAEMRQARLQAVRPLFELTTCDELEWRVDRAPSPFDWNAFRQLGIRFKNIGAGQALDIHAGLSFQARELRADSKNRLRHFLAMHDIECDFHREAVKFSVRGNSILEASPLAPERGRMGPSIGVDLGRCEPGQAVEFRVFPNYAAFVAILAIAKAINPFFDPRHPVSLAQAELYVSYRSFTGETFREDYRVDILGFCTISWADPLQRGTSKAWNWLQAHASLSVSKPLAELTTAQAFVWSIFGDENARERLTGKTRRQRLHERWVRRRARRRRLKRRRR